MTSVSLTLAVGEPANLYLPVDPPADLSVSAALNYLKLKPGSTVSISDTSLNIQKNLSTLQALNGRITAVKSSNEDSKVLNVTYKEYQVDKGILSKWSNNTGHQFNFIDISAAAAYQFWNQDFTNTLSVKDTAINIQNNFSNLLSIHAQNGGKLASMTQLNTSALISLSTSQFAEAESSDFLKKLNKGINNFAITNATVSDVVGSSSALGYKPSIKSISILDTTDNIDNRINDLRGVGMKIKTISQNNLTEDNVLELTASEIKANSSVLGKIITGYQLAAQNTSASQLSAIISNRKVISIDVKDTAINISRNWDSLNSYSNSINIIEVIPPAAGSSATNIINIKASQLANSKILINKFPPPVNSIDSFKLNVLEATASQANDLLNSNEISSFDVKDTAENIGKYITDLFSGRAKINSVRTANSNLIEMSYSVYSSPDMTSILAKINKGAYNLKLTDVSVDQLAFITSPVLSSNALFLDKSIGSVELVDSSTNIEDNLSLLNAVGARLSSISIDYATDIADSSNLILSNLKLDAQDFLKSQRVLEKIIGGYKVDIQKSTVKQALSLSSNIHVQSIDIEDNSVNISSAWNKLIDINSQLDDIFISGAAVSITAAQYDQGVDAALQAKFSDTIPVTFAIKNASIDKALALIDADTNDLITSIEIRDTGENITDNFLQLQDLITQHTNVSTKLYQLDPRNALDVSFEDLTEYNDVLTAINGQGYKLTLNGASVAQALAATVNVSSTSTPIKYKNITSVNINDTSVNVGDNFNSLLLMGKKLSSISLDNLENNIVNTEPLVNISISYNQYITGKYVLDRIKDNYNLEIKDAAVYNAPSLALDKHIQAINVYGTSTYISKAWDVLSGLGSKLKTIYNTTSLSTSLTSANKIATSINLNISQWLSSSSLLSKFGVNNQNFTVYDATIADASLIISDSAQASLIKNIQVEDNAESIDAAFDSNLSVLRNGLISDISLVNPSKPIDLTYSQFNDSNNQPVFDKISKFTDGSSVVTNNFLLNINTALAVNAVSISNKTSSPSYSKNINLINISDSSSNIQNSFNSLKTISKINTIALTTADAEISLTATNVLQSESISLLKKIVDDSYVDTSTPPTYRNHPYALNITDISMSQLNKLHSWDSSTDGPIEPMLDSELLPLVRDYYLSDSAQNITNSYDKLIALGGNLKGFSFTDAAGASDIRVAGDISISYNQWIASKDKLDALPVDKKPTDTNGNAIYKFILSDVTAQDAVGGNTVAVGGVVSGGAAASIFIDPLVKSIVVKDNASAIAANWAALNQEYENVNSKLSSLIFTIPNDGPRTLMLSAAQVIKVNNPDNVSLQTLFEQVTSTNPVVIRDSSANIATYFDALSILYGSGSGLLGDRLSAIDLTDDFGVNISNSQLTSDSRALIISKLEGNYDSIKVDGEWYSPSGAV